LSLTSLFISYSLLLPTFYGLIFLGDKVSIFFAPAIILLVTSLFLINKRSDKKQINPKWIFYVVLATVGNGFCSVIQKMQQMVVQ
jgi:drug/metabolite transporter (DMT)-like permease